MPGRHRTAPRTPRSVMDMFLIVKLRQATLTRALICVCRTCALGNVGEQCVLPALFGVDLSSRIRASTLVSKFLSVHYTNARTSVCRVRTSHRCVGASVQANAVI